MPSSPESRENRTNDRFIEWSLRVLARLSPELAAAAAERLFFTPPRPRPSRGESRLREASPLELTLEGEHLAAWRFGQGPAVLLLHGWGGRAAQLTSFVSPLLERGLGVVALDAPGHGRSGRRLSSAPQFAHAITIAAQAVGGLHGVVAHSLGAAATAFAIADGLSVRRVVFLAPAADPPAWVNIFAARFGLPHDVVARLRQRSERRLGLRWEDLHVPSLTARAEVPLLVIHDRDDRDVPFEDGALIAAAAREGRLMETRGLGHTGLLRDPAVVNAAVTFLCEGVSSRCSCGAPSEDGRDCESCRLERELFERDTRSDAVSL